MLNDFEKLGRYLCKLYYAPESKRALEAAVRSVVESVVMKQRCWLSLMSGDLRRISARENFLGPIVVEEIRSLDGAEMGLRMKEVTLYCSIGKAFIDFLTFRR